MARGRESKKEKQRAILGSATADKKQKLKAEGTSDRHIGWEEVDGGEREDDDQSSPDRGITSG